MTQILLHFGLIDYDNVYDIRFDDTDDSDNDSITTQSDDDNELYVHENPYCHVLDPEDDSFLNDVDAYGLAYARYKARIMRRTRPDGEPIFNTSESSEQSM